MSLPSAANPASAKVIYQTLILMLVAVAGMTDATFYLHSKELLGVYITGDTSKMAQFLQQGNLAKVLALAGIIGLFLASTTFAAWLANRRGRNRAPIMLLIVALFICLAWPFSAPDYPYGVVLLLVMAMGTLNQVCRNEPGVTFVTGTLVKLGRKLAQGQWSESVPLALRWLVWLISAFVGALLDSYAADMTLLIIAGWCLLVALFSLVTHNIIPGGVYTSR